jgi:hypothetical protein
VGRERAREYLSSIGILPADMQDVAKGRQQLGTLCGARCAPRRTFGFVVLADGDERPDQPALCLHPIIRACRHLRKRGGSFLVFPGSQQRRGVVD